MRRRLKPTRTAAGTSPAPSGTSEPHQGQSPPQRARLGVRRRSIRVRLTLTYWVFFVVSGAVMLILTVGVWQVTTKTQTRPAPGPGAPASSPGAGAVLPGASQHGSDLHGLLLAAGIALVVMAIPAIALGWAVGGRYLRPLRTITSTARAISASNLHRRLELSGPNDELKELGDTIDDLLARLERSFQSERRFVANASHELRTPLATMRASIDVAMAKPGSVPAQTVALADRLRPELSHIEQLLEGFLFLAHTQQGPSGDQITVSLAALTAKALERRAEAISLAQLDVTQENDLRIPWVTGSETLLARMVDNVVDNAVKHNQPGGWINLRATVEDNTARLVVANGGRLLSQADLHDLTRPFRRLGPERTNSAGGSGLGLSIVEAIAEAHQGRLELHANEAGGLRVILTLPLAAAPREVTAT